MGWRLDLQNEVQNAGGPWEGCAFFSLSASFLCDFLGRITSSWDRLATCRHRADSGQETDCT